MCGSLEKSCILHTAIALAALLMMKMFLRLIVGRYVSFCNCGPWITNLVSGGGYV
jgi:hypothetical protein